MSSHPRRKPGRTRPNNPVTTKETCNAGLQIYNIDAIYRCGRVDRGVQPPNTSPVSETLVFSLFGLSPQTDGQSDGQTDRWMDGRTKPLVELYVPVTYNFLHTFEVTLSKLILQENVWEKPNSSVWSAVSG